MTWSGTPYHVEYRQFLEPAAKALRDAAALSADPAFAKFLRLRADALLSDDYYASDLAWLDLKDPKFDVIMAPYETYLDDLAGREDVVRRGGPGAQRKPRARSWRCIRSTFRISRMRCRWRPPDRPPSAAI